MKSLKSTFLLSTILLLASCNLPVQSPPVAAPTQRPAASPQPTQAAVTVEHSIGVRQGARGAEFYDRTTGQTFVVRGANYIFIPQPGGSPRIEVFQVGTYDPARTRADFARLAQLGYNTVRVFLDHCSRGSGCIADADNVGLNPAYLANIADMTQAARQAGIQVLFTSNDLPDQGGYSEQASSPSGATFAGYRNSYYLTPGAITATRRYWRDLITGLMEQGLAPDAVLGWQLLNEQWMFLDQPPLSLRQGTVETTTGSYDMSSAEQRRRMVSDGLIYYIDQMKEEILTHDPTALVTMGFFVPELVAPTWFVDTAPLLTGSNLDFFDFHGYPGPLSLAQHAEAFGMLGYNAKPILLGEYGAFRSRYPKVAAAGRALTAWMADSCPLGFDGWLYWAYYPAGAQAGDETWGLTEENGYLMDLMAPANQPDPCVPVAIASTNLAFGRAATASRSLPDQPPSLAVDEDAATQWGAGLHPPQWIEIDLGSPTDIARILLTSAQFPDGPTVHQIWVRGPSDSLRQVSEFRGATHDSQVLEFAPSTPLSNVQFLRILTITSPSWVAWKEVEIYGDGG
jgi:preprotein translocase subunit Sec61beta